MWTSWGGLFSVHNLSAFVVGLCSSLFVPCKMQQWANLDFKRNSRRRWKTSAMSLNHLYKTAAKFEETVDAFDFSSLITQERQDNRISRTQAFVHVRRYVRTVNLVPPLSCSRIFHTFTSFTVSTAAIQAVSFYYGQSKSGRQFHLVLCIRRQMN